MLLLHFKYFFYSIFPCFPLNCGKTRNTQVSRLKVPQYCTSYYCTSINFPALAATLQTVRRHERNGAHPMLDDQNFVCEKNSYVDHPLDNSFIYFFLRPYECIVGRSNVYSHHVFVESSKGQ